MEPLAPWGDYNRSVGLHENRQHYVGHHRERTQLPLYPDDEKDLNDDVDGFGDRGGQHGEEKTSSGLWACIRGRLVRKKVCTCHLGADFQLPKNGSDFQPNQLNFPHTTINQQNFGSRNQLQPTKSQVEPRSQFEEACLPALPPPPPSSWKPAPPSRGESVDLSPRQWQGIEELLLDTCKRLELRERELMLRNSLPPSTSLRNPPSSHTPPSNSQIMVDEVQKSEKLGEIFMRR